MNIQRKQLSLLLLTSLSLLLQFLGEKLLYLVLGVRTLMLDEAINKKVNPFGGGTSLCPGTEVAKLEATIFLHHLILKYRWKLKEDNDFPLSYPYLEFSKGLKLEIQPTEDIN